MSERIIAANYRVPFAAAGNAGAERVRLSVVADLHDKRFGEDQSLLLDALKASQPDLIILAGDLLTAKAGRCRMDNALALASRLTQICPVYAVDGNHETRLLKDPASYPGKYRLYKNTLKSAGIHLLNQRTEAVSACGNTLRITGYAAPLSCYRRVHRKNVTPQMIERACGSPEKGTFQILLAHHPDFFSAYAQWGADLTLSGHLHGGMIRLGPAGGLIGAQLTPFPFYDRGLYRIGNSRMIVSAGLGSHTIPVRVNDPPEIVSVELVPKS